MTKATRLRSCRHAGDWHETHGARRKRKGQERSDETKPFLPSRFPIPPSFSTPVMSIVAYLITVQSSHSHDLAFEHLKWYGAECAVYEYIRLNRRRFFIRSGDEPNEGESFVYAFALKAVHRFEYASEAEISKAITLFNATCSAFDDDSRDGACFVRMDDRKEEEWKILDTRILKSKADRKAEDRRTIKLYVGSRRKKFANITQEDVSRMVDDQREVYSTLNAYFGGDL